MPLNIKASSDIREVIGFKYILIAVPAQTLRQVLSTLPKGTYSFIICSKGVEQGTLKLMSEVVLEILPGSEISILSGPNFATEVARDLPGVTTIASQNLKTANNIAQIFMGSNFKVYISRDIIGVQICAAAKNVIAIACGICEGAGLGENAKAAILMEGINEIKQLVSALGGEDSTILSPAGIGDLTLTCGSKASRNMTYGVILGSEKPNMNQLAEGSYAAKSVAELAKKHNLNLPLINSVAKAVEEPESAVKEILKIFS